jgi:transcriptional regulator of acetoin/glycerol metabolism
MLCDSDEIGPELFDLPAAPPPSIAPPASDPAGDGGSGVASDSTSPSGNWLLSDTERVQIERALVAAGGSRARAASLLGISRTTLWKRLKDYGLAC